MNLNRFVKIKQHFPRPVITDIPGHIRARLQKINLPARLQPGQKIAITAGSRGIASMPTILRTLVEAVRAAGAQPFVLAAMGSHGGGSVQGQLEVLAALGITENSLGCPVLATAETVEIGQTAGGFRVYCDALAWQADGILVVNRVKPHTTFHGPVESGLLKMLTVGLGKAPGAGAFHRTRPEAMARTLLEVGDIFLHSGKVLAGLAIVENGYEEIALLEATLPQDLIALEQKLLQEAYRLLPRLPVESLDFLVVEEMGKNISGTGMDVNVIGRIRMVGVPEPRHPFIERIVVLDLTAPSHGNATGIGLADITTARLAGKINWETTYLNCLTSGNLQRAMLPVVMPDDEKAIAAALQSLAAGHPDNLQGAIIKNTRELEYLLVTENLARKLAGRDDIEIAGPPRALVFSGGRLALDWQA